MGKETQQFIKIRGARVHNLKGIDVDIPKNKLVVITGVSGSGKSSLAFDTLYAEGRRRYIESLSAYARQFLGQLEKPEVEKIEGLSPAIAIEQKSLSHNPRSTVGTVTEVYDYLRLLFARAGRPHCPQCKRPVTRQSIDEIIKSLLNFAPGTRFLILGPAIKGKKGEHRKILEELDRQGLVRVRLDNEVLRLEEALERTLERYQYHNIEAVVDRWVVPDRGLLGFQELKDERSRLADSIETALKIGQGVMIAAQAINLGAGQFEDYFYSQSFACPYCDISLPEIEPRSFSFNSPYGACPECHGLGVKLEPAEELVIPDKTLSIAQGAIAPWAQASHRVGRQSWFWYILQGLSRELAFSLQTPWQNLPKSIRQVILYGDREFEGVMPQLMRRYQETESEGTRQEISRYLCQKPCPGCQGKRLKKEFLAVQFWNHSISDLAAKSIKELYNFFILIQNKGIKNKNRFLTSTERAIAEPLVREILKRLEFLVKVGLDYLTLERRSATLAGGEAQRIQLATQLGSGLTGVLYILDEPSIGLHARDQARLIATLKNLRDLGNTVVVVEHDAQMIENADWVIDLGLGGGEAGGKVIAQGTPSQIKKSNTLTSQYLKKKLKVASSSKKPNPPATPLRSDGGRGKLKAKSSPRTAPKGLVRGYKLILKGACQYNLKNLEVAFPLGSFICVTGVSGSGKSTLINDTLGCALRKKLHRAKLQPGKYKTLKGWEHLDRVVVIDQSPIGRTPRSNPATYTGLFGFIRQIFSQTSEARARGYLPGRFSFNVKSGRCEACQGQGVKEVEMQFLPSVYVTCEICQGKRYQKEVLEVEYKAKNIFEVLEMEISEALKFFENIPALKRRLAVLSDIGLDYLKLGQPAPTLSGGEAQRVKLAKELLQYQARHSLYLLDEPTTGLHGFDIEKLLKILRSLVEQGNTVIVIEHNLQVVAVADHIIDLGPEGGDKGGKVVALGSPQEIAKAKKSYTGQYLKALLCGDEPRRASLS
jgi:excinuclease ABC subunit A